MKKIIIIILLFFIYYSTTIAQSDPCALNGCEFVTTRTLTAHLMSCDYTVTYQIWTCPGPPQFYTFRITSLTFNNTSDQCNLDRQTAYFQDQMFKIAGKVIFEQDPTIVNQELNGCFINMYKAACWMWNGGGPYYDGSGSWLPCGEDGYGCCITSYDITVIPGTPPHVIAIPKANTLALPCSHILQNCILFCQE